MPVVIPVVPNADTVSNKISIKLCATDIFLSVKLKSKVINNTVARLIKNTASAFCNVKKEIFLLKTWV